MFRRSHHAAEPLDEDSFTAALREACRGFADLAPEQTRKLFRHYALLVRWNAVAGLVSARALREIVHRHYAESIFLGQLLPAGRSSVLDLGSGGGFPGVPIAACRPELEVWLCERTSKKRAFLKEVTRGWANVNVIADVGEGPEVGFDWLISRAVNTEEVVAVAARASRGLALLSTVETLKPFRHDGRIEWISIHPVPWGDRRVAALGRVVTP